MTRFTTSAPTRPHYESNRYRPSPARREAIHGKIRPMDSEPSKAEGIFLLYGLIFGLIAVYLFAVRPS
jgi:hypothetical protein